MPAGTTTEWIIKFATQDAAKVKGVLDGMGVSTRNLNKDMDKTGKNTKTFGQNLASLAGRAALTIPIWIALRSVLQPIAEFPQRIIETWISLEKEMGRVAAVTRGTSFDLQELEKVIIDFSRTSTRDFTEAAKVMFQLGSAGLSVRQQIAGLEPIMSLTVATFADAEQTAKLVAGAFNVFGDSIEGVSTDAQRFTAITDTLAAAFRDQQVELSELQSGLAFSASVAGLLDIKFHELVGTIGFLNTGMLKGSKAGCYDKETEVLTKEGFKYWKDCTINDEYATLNPETHQLEYQKPTRMVKELWDGYMIKFKNRYLDLLVTPDHHMYTKSRGEKAKYEDNYAKELLGRPRYYKRDCKWEGESPEYFYLPSIPKWKNQFKCVDTGEKPILIKTWLKFMGYYLSEGWVRIEDKNGKHRYSINISQYPNSKYINNIKKCLDDLVYKYNYTKNCFYFYDKQLAYYLKQFNKCKKKFIPDFIKNLNPDLLKIFLNAYIDGDGSRQENRFYIGTASKQMKDDLMEIALKAGYGVSSCLHKNTENECWTISVNNVKEFLFSYKDSKRVANQHGYENKCEEKLVYYTDYVYCAEVPNHILFIRRNGKTVWCKNTSLLNAFAQIAIKSDKLGKLGVQFDPTAPLNLVHVMEQLSDIYGGHALSLVELREIMQTFGRRGGRAIALIIQDFERWKAAIGDSEASFRGFTDMMEEKATHTLPMAFARLGNSMKAGFVQTLDSLAETIKLIEIIETIVEQRKLEELGRRFLDVKGGGRQALNFGLLQGAPFEAIRVGAGAEVETRGGDRLVQLLERAKTGREEILKSTKQQNLLDATLENIIVRQNKGILTQIQAKLELGVLAASLAKWANLDIIAETKLLRLLEAELDIEKKKNKLELTTGGLTPKIEQAILKDAQARLKAEGALTSELIKQEIALEKQLNIESGIEDKILKQIELERALTEEKRLQTTIGNESLKLFEIAKTEGIEVAKSIGDVLADKSQFTSFFRKGGRSLEVFKEQFGDLFKGLQAEAFFRGDILKGFQELGGGTRIQTQERFGAPRGRFDADVAIASARARTRLTAAGYIPAKEKLPEKENTVATVSNTVAVKDNTNAMMTLASNIATFANRLISGVGQAVFSDVVTKKGLKTEGSKDNKALSRSLSGVDGTQNF